MGGTGGFGPPSSFSGGIRLFTEFFPIQAEEPRQGFLNVPMLAP